MSKSKKLSNRNKIIFNKKESDKYRISYQKSIANTACDTIALESIGDTLSDTEKVSVMQ